MQPVVQQFEVANFDIHEDRSITMAINTKKKQEINDMRPLPQEKENAAKFTAPVPIAPTQQSVCILSFINYYLLSYVVCYVFLRIHEIL